MRSPSGEKRIAVSGTIATCPVPHTSIAIRDVGGYSARNSSKGALIEEAARIFAALETGASIAEVRDLVLHGTLLSQRSSQNRKQIWKSVSQRYLVQDEPWLIREAELQSQQGPHNSEFVSLLYLLYALRDRLTFDFVTSVLWSKIANSKQVVSRNDVLDLLAAATPSQPQIERWSESTRVKLAGSVLTALRDFGLLEGKQKKVLIQPTLPTSTAQTLLRILMREGCRGRQVLENPTWRLFLLKEADVAQLLARLAQDGVIRFEKAGTTVVLELPVAWESKS
jgi:hypothetical protein